MELETQGNASEAGASMRIMVNDYATRGYSCTFSSLLLALVADSMDFVVMWTYSA
jgi:hypothetical protein